MKRDYVVNLKQSLLQSMKARDYLSFPLSQHGQKYREEMEVEVKDKLREFTLAIFTFQKKNVNYREGVC